MIFRDYGRSFMQMFIQNVIGEDGIRFQGSARTRQEILDTELNDTLQKAWSEWGQEMHCDLGGGEKRRI